MAIEYFLNKKSTVCVVSFTGRISGHDTTMLEQCASSVQEAGKFRYVILNLSGVRGYEAEADRPFTKFLRDLRAKATLLVCQMNEGVEQELKKRGLLRDNEVAADLMTALARIMAQEKRE